MTKSCAFVRDIATNHLPHIYSALHAIARKQGIEPSEPPLKERDAAVRAAKRGKRPAPHRPRSKMVRHRRRRRRHRRQGRPLIAKV